MALDGTDPADEARVTGARIGPGGLLARPRLVEHLRRAVRGRLTVVSAPAGSGKTVALEQWVAGHRDGPVTWVAPAGSDAGRRPVRGLDGPTAGGGRHRAPPSADTGDAVVVVDPLPDSAPATAAGLEPLLAGVPDGAHVVVATRRRWPAPAGGDPEVVARLDEGDLALTAPEAGTVLAAASGRQDLTPRHVEVLLARTAGWPAGLRLAAAALRHAPDLDRFVDGFTGEEPHVAGFLRHEVLAGQAAGVRRFLTCTSVLDRLGGPLCDALTGDGGGAATLRSLEARGLFTRAVAPGGWYAYHPLFRDVLRQELRRRAPHAEAELLARAAAWHVDHDDPEPAARYLAEAEAWDELVRLVDHHGSPAGRSGGAERGLRWLDALPGGTSPRRPDGATRRAYLLTTQGRARLAQRLLHEAGSDPADPGERVLRQAVRALWGFLDAPPAPVVEAADAVLAEVDRVEPADIPDILGATSPATLRSLAAGSRGRALWSLGDLPASRAAFALAAAGPDVPLPWEPAVLGARALLEAWSGHLRVARALAGRALAVAGPPLAHHPVTVDARLAAAHVARERGELPLADGYLGEVAALVAGSERPTALAVHAVERGLWHLAAGRPDRGLAVVEGDRARGGPPPPPLVDRWRRAVAARLLLALGDVDRAAAVVGARAGAGPPGPDLAAVAVQVEVARGDLVAARARLDRWDVADGAGARAGLEHRLWGAVVAAGTGGRRRALATVSSVVADARAEGHVRSLLDGGPAVEHLLRDLCRTTPAPYLRHLVQQIAPRHGLAAVGAGVGAGLSRRELEVVRYLPTSLSNGEIAGRLFISPNTLKTHLRSIYRKLGAGTRRGAARRAVDLGLA